MEVGDGRRARRRPKACLEELAHQWVVAQMRPRSARDPAQQGQPLRGRRESRDVRDGLARHDLGKLGRDHLEDRRLHEEPLQLILELADDLLGEVVVHLVVGAAEARTNRRISAGERSRSAAWTIWSEAIQPSVRSGRSVRTSASSRRP